MNHFSISPLTRVCNAMYIYKHLKAFWYDKSLVPFQLRSHLVFAVPTLIDCHFVALLGPNVSVNAGREDLLHACKRDRILKNMLAKKEYIYIISLRGQPACPALLKLQSRRTSASHVRSLVLAHACLTCSGASNSLRLLCGAVYLLICAFAAANSFS